ncbi:hypothetical protein L2E82_35853 [Cichorium intybus]|uniref:Uncharacterized protein n=1 Tax=Cichorium intybus TaxID=13427 RepID=A0ACB9BQ81_CICIN|nr:hypothetical protein L2E82_35853 [Cichorium intybus]
MDIERHTSSRNFQVPVYSTPTTPSNPDFSKSKTYFKNGSEEQLNSKVSGKILMDNVWTHIPCSDLLALADAAATTTTTKGSGGVGLDMHSESSFMMSDSQQCPLDETRYLFDLNSPPLTEPESIASITTQLTPVTPKQTITTDEDKEDDDVSELEVDEEFEEELSDDSNLKKTPQPKQKRRKHRPKVVKEGQVKTSKGLTIKRKYVRKIVNEANNPTTVAKTRRKINFEEEHDFGQLGQVTGDKNKTHIDFTILESQAVGPITPNKYETTPEKIIKHKWSRAKRNINFSKNDSSTSEGQETRGTKREFESLEEYLSMSTKFNNGGTPGLYFPTIFKKKRTEKCRGSVTSRAISSFWFKGFDNVGGFRKKRSKGVKRMRDLGSFNGIWLEHKKALRRKRYTCMEALVNDYGVNIATKKRTKRSSIVASSYYNYWFLTNHIGFHPGFRWKTTYDINTLINQFENLDINNRTSKQDRRALVPYLTRYRERNGIVLYKQERRVVPFEDDYDSLKKRKARPKVDLDEETSRVWRLLLEDINSEGIDGTDDDKTKWWEDERNVFRGRAVSFIARMHLVQGDRRFSQWKGSVVDSVTGVFLTQNVSDHASSSAFMSLAAKYPLKSKSSHEPCELDIEETQESITWSEENPNQQLSQDLNSLTLKNTDSYIESNSFHDNSGSEESGISTESTTQEPLKSSIIQSEEHDMFKCRMISDIMNNNQDVQKAENENITGEISEVHERKNEDGNIAKMESGIGVKKGKSGKVKKSKVDWDGLRRRAQVNGKRERTVNSMDSLDYEAVRLADVDEISDTIKDRGMNNMLAERIKAFLNRLVRDHGSIDLEWLRDVPPDKAKEYLLSFRGLGLKSVECVRLLTLHHLAFPVDTNVGRIAVRLGWVPLQPLPESLQLHLLELYPVLESIQKYLWPRLCKLDQRTLYELHYQMITFGKVFCTKNKPNCNACPMRGECRHFASAFASARLSLPSPEEKSIVTATTETQNPTGLITYHRLPPPPNHHLPPLPENIEQPKTPEPIIEEPSTPEPEKIQEFDMEDFYEEENCEEIPTIRLNMEAFTHNLQNYMENNMDFGENDMSRALVALTSEAASIPTPKLKNVSQLRTEHQVYELPDSHPLLEGLDKREPDDPCSYLLAIWTPGETAESIQPPLGQCSSHESGNLCHEKTCFSCNSIREANSQTVRGTLLIPCRTAMRGSFPLNGTYFQVNEVFADHDSSLNPIDVPRSWLWNLPRRTVYFGTSIPTIFKGLTTEGIQYCFWRGFVCVRGFDQKTRAPRPLMARLHFPVSKLKRSRGKDDENN